MELDQTHIAPLIKFVDKLRSKYNLGENIPHFDPLDGGINAEVLFLLEAPGPRAVKSGFVSRNNDDPTARNFLALNHEAGITREGTIMWNIVPQYLGDVNSIRRPTASELRVGITHLFELLNLLPELRVVVFVGAHAYNAANQALSIQRPDLELFRCGHTSNQHLNRNIPINRQNILNIFHEVLAYLEIKKPQVKPQSRFEKLWSNAFPNQLFPSRYTLIFAVISIAISLYVFYH